MTHGPEPAASSAAEPRPSMLPFDPADLVALRVRPAEFARMCDVSKQAVSQWIKSGKVTLGPDGKLDPAKAAREVFQHSNPARIRARVFKSAMESRDELRARIRALEERLEIFHVEREAWLQAAQFRFSDEQAFRLAALQDAIEARFGELCDAHASGQLPDRLDSIVEAIFYPEHGARAEAAAAESNQAGPDAFTGSGDPFSADAAIPQEEKTHE